jgi:Fic family protein
MNWKSYPYHFPGQEKHLDRLQEKKSRLDALRPLPAAVLQNLRNSLALEWTFHSNAIEGNTLTLRETRMVVEDGLTVGGKSLREHFEAINHQEAIAFVESLAANAHPLSSADILALHGLVMQKIDPEFAGRFRNGGVRIAGAGFIPPSALKIGSLTEELLQWANDAHNSFPTIIKAAIFHHRFVWIHPFFDGNGRTARLLSNLLLMKEGFPPAIILKNDRKKYYDALEKANQGSYAKLPLLFMQALERSLDLYLSNLTSSYDDYQPISDIAAEPGFTYSQEYLSLLARQGKIDAFKEGRNWLTSKEAVKRYVEGRERKR